MTGSQWATVLIFAIVAAALAFSEWNDKRK